MSDADVASGVVPENPPSSSASKGKKKSMYFSVFFFEPCKGTCDCCEFLIDFKVSCYAIGNC
jgi:hypothetical protein